MKKRMCSTIRNSRKAFLCFLFAFLEAVSSHFVKLYTLLGKSKKEPHTLLDKSVCRDHSVQVSAFQIEPVNKLINQAVQFRSGVSCHLVVKTLHKSRKKKISLLAT